MAANIAHILKSCETCGKSLSRKQLSKNPEQRFCGRACLAESMRDKTIPSELKLCEVCKKPIPKEQTRSWRDYQRKRFCGVVCKALGTANHVVFLCEQCGKRVNRGRSLYSKAAHHFCSQSCAGLFYRNDVGDRFRGKNNTNWRGGISDYPNHTLFKRHRLIRLKSENWQCQICGSPSGVVHHINGQKNDHRLINLLVVCHDCHWDIERNRRAKTTKYRRAYGMTLARIATMLQTTTGTAMRLHRIGLLPEVISSGMTYRDYRAAHKTTNIRVSRGTKYSRKYGLRLREISSLLGYSVPYLCYLEKVGRLESTIKDALKQTA